MKKIFIPTQSANDWQQLLAEPEKHWRTGYSAKALASCWEAASPAVPEEVSEIFKSSSYPNFHNIELLLAFPEWKVYIPPRQGHPSQNDLFVLAKDAQGDLVTIMVEGKVNEPFAQRCSEWMKNLTPGKKIRLDYLQSTLGLTNEILGTIRYQLLHRTASALYEAERFQAKSAVMLVHSFSQNLLWFDDYTKFLCLFGKTDIQSGKLYHLRTVKRIELYSCWACGNPKFLCE